MSRNGMSLDPILLSHLTHEDWGLLEAREILKPDAVHLQQVQAWGPVSHDTRVCLIGLPVPTLKHWTLVILRLNALGYSDSAKRHLLGPKKRLLSPRLGN